MKRLFIIRKDLEITSKQLSKIVGQSIDNYWSSIIKDGRDYYEDGAFAGYLIYLDKNFYNNIINNNFDCDIIKVKNLSEVLQLKDEILNLNSVDEDNINLLYFNGELLGFSVLINVNMLA